MLKKSVSAHSNDQNSWAKTCANKVLTRLLGSSPQERRLKLRLHTPYLAIVGVCTALGAAVGLVYGNDAETVLICIGMGVGVGGFVTLFTGVPEDKELLKEMEAYYLGVLEQKLEAVPEVREP